MSQGIPLPSSGTLSSPVYLHHREGRQGGFPRGDGTWVGRKLTNWDGSGASEHAPATGFSLVCSRTGDGDSRERQLLCLGGTFCCLLLGPVGCLAWKCRHHWVVLFFSHPWRADSWAHHTPPSNSGSLWGVASHSAERPCSEKWLQCQSQAFYSWDHFSSFPAHPLLPQGADPTSCVAQVPRSAGFCPNWVNEGTDKRREVSGDFAGSPGCPLQLQLPLDGCFMVAGPALQYLHIYSVSFQLKATIHPYFANFWVVFTILCLTLGSFTSCITNSLL